LKRATIRVPMNQLDSPHQKSQKSSSSGSQCHPVPPMTERGLITSCEH
jgi:hypothetical protein